MLAGIGQISPLVATRHQVLPGMATLSPTTTACSSPRNWPTLFGPRGPQSRCSWCIPQTFYGPGGSDGAYVPVDGFHDGADRIGVCGIGQHGPPRRGELGRPNPAR